MLKLSGPPAPRSVLSLDIGRRRIGMAGCDPLGITIKPLQPLQRRSFSLDLAKISNVCSKRDVRSLIVGLPLDVTGKFTSQSHHCWRYGFRLAKALGIPLAMANEYGSSIEAAALYKLHNSDRSGRLDSAAAALLLEQWLQEGPEPVLIQSLVSKKAKTFSRVGGPSSWPEAGDQ